MPQGVTYIVVNFSINGVQSDLMDLGVKPLHTITINDWDNNPLTFDYDGKIINSFDTSLIGKDLFEILAQRALNELKEDEKEQATELDATNILSFLMDTKLYLEPFILPEVLDYLLLPLCKFAYGSYDNENKGTGCIYIRSKRNKGLQIVVGSRSDKLFATKGLFPVNV